MTRATFAPIVEAMRSVLDVATTVEGRPGGPITHLSGCEIDRHFCDCGHRLDRHGPEAAGCIECRCRRIPGQASR